ncbi:NAD(P)-dependent oxidoreductase [Streptomyces tuirus]|uniref:NAD(P)-dependent oxidoreductase n=1 Tax=Streptomyces tuirus TaxID=68278 RepID=A0A941FI66_9ACTN|nr:NAD(P)-dependent oxidoreductase [Streptomyces tuirus]
MTVASQTVGFLGLGAMGLPMATNLVKAGFDVIAWNRSRPALEAAGAAGCRTAADPAEVAAATSVVITMLPDLPQVEALLQAGDGLLAPPGRAMDTLVVMGTVSPVRVRALAGDLTARGVTVVDAPVSGGVTGAAQGTLSVMVGAEPAPYDRVLPYLEAMGGTVRRMGGVGAGSLTKACNQLVVAGTLVSLAEAVLLAERGGLDTEALLDVLAGGLARSEVLTQKHHHLSHSDFTASGPARYLLKDLGFVQDSADDERVSLPLADTVTGLYRAVEDQGLGEYDNSVVLRLLRGAEPAGAREIPHPYHTKG